MKARSCDWPRRFCKGKNDLGANKGEDAHAAGLPVSGLRTPNKTDGRPGTVSLLSQTRKEVLPALFTPAETLSRQALSEEVATGQASHTTITTADNPLIHSPNCSEPATNHHVGSLSTAYRTHRRRRGSQCHKQASFGTHPTGPGPRIQRPRASSTSSLASLLYPRFPSLQLNVWLTDWVIQRFASTSSSAEGAGSAWKNNALPAAATIFAVGSTAWYWQLYGRNADAMTPAEEGLHPTQYPWEHEKWHKTFDHGALRRGFQVYREVCASCHSISRVPYRAVVGKFMTVDEAKALAEENEYDTEPNDQGEIEKRPGKLSDYMPSPYKNDEAARAANNGALPPDLSLMVKARHGGCNYIFSLLTGYPEEPPAGAVVQEGLNFNPYFPGTGIAMARVLYDDLVEYDDGTKASTSQMAKDVVEFLNWTAEPEMDDRKKMGWKVLAVTSVLFAISVWVKRYKWAPLKTRKIVYQPPQNKSILDHVPKPNNSGKTNQ
ncbi:hypothetical protein PTT_09805 [Pyrenophora teres f. teres 0-1]|uniref:quinol--cytochrome-c reductase n=1 Tax=Pyrenophora teres f. teres (strain 0-1) TaxID=861557 RepID=E3RMS8_PYRTT|nr:hypothetical protein PTT_09805 [Pyrenophora teres f. teres 0-1]KAE8838631.1 hypothetical protein HRS9139_03014 [Pyrenophora teres f. teres]